LHTRYTSAYGNSTSGYGNSASAYGKSVTGYADNFSSDGKPISDEFHRKIWTNWKKFLRIR